MAAGGKWRKAALAAAAAFAVLAGCGQDDQAGDRHYQDDEALGLTNTNPNLFNGANWSYSQDIKVMRETLSGIKGVQDATIVVEGGTAFVRLRLPGWLSRSEVETVEQNAYLELRRQVPRMDFKVTSDKSDYYE